MRNFRQSARTLRLVPVAGLLLMLLTTPPALAQQNVAVGQTCAPKTTGDVCGTNGDTQGATCQRIGGSYVCQFTPCGAKGECPKGYECGNAHTASGQHLQACLPPGAADIGAVQTGTIGSTPTPAIPIPTVNFGKIKVYRQGQEQFVDVPWLADYITGVYKWAVGAAAVVGATMMMIGGFQYLTAGGDAGKVEKAKKRITNALVGLLLSVGAYLTLYVVNPELVQFSALRFDIAQQVLYVSPALSKPQYGHGPIDPAVAAAVIKAAKKAGVDACTMLAICDHETGLMSPPMWSGKLGGTPSNTATSFGPCQVALSNFRDGSSNNPKLAAAYPDYPADGSLGTATEHKDKRRQWLLTNVEGAAYAGAMLFKMTGQGVGGVAAYGVGSGTISAWQKLNPGCKPQKLSIADAAGMGADAALAAACIPSSPAVPTLGDACASDGGNCTNGQWNSRAEYWGTCASTGAKCVSIPTQDFVRFVIKAYSNMKQQFPDCAPPSS